MVKCGKVVFTFTIIVFLSFLLFSCAAKEIVIKDESGELIAPQKILLEGQKAVDEANYDLALLYYQALIDNYSENKEYVAWAHYEMGYVYFLLEDYENAKLHFKVIVEDYKDQKSPYALAQFMLSKIEDIENETTEEPEEETEDTESSEENS